MDVARKHVLISGLVQGVAFRYWTHRRARERGLSGWVRNRSDGRVEAVFQGPRSEVDELVEWCHHGPPAARVTEVLVNEEPPDPALDGFAVLETR